MRYTLKRSLRAKYMRLRVHPGGAVVLTVPAGTETGVIREFIRSRTRWLTNAIQQMMQFRTLPVSGRRDYLKHKETARAFIHERIAFWNQYYGFEFNRVAIKNTSRIWGSCSRKGNLNFSYALMFLPRELADYVVIHELCHLKEHNHGKAFWALVGKACPDYARFRRELRRYLPRS